MDPESIGPMVGGGAAGAIIAIVGSVVVKLFLTYTGWKKDKNRSTQDELYRIVDALYTDIEKQRQDRERDRAKTDIEVLNLRADNERCRAREHEQSLKLTRLEFKMSLCVEKLSRLDPVFKTQLENSDVHPALPENPRGENEHH